MEELRYQLYEEEMRECTFRPQITEVASRLSSYPPALQSHEEAEDASTHSFDNESFHSGSAVGVPAYERLYHQKNKVPKSIMEKRHRSREERELDGCTFAPQLFHTKNHSETSKRSSTNITQSRRGTLDQREGESEEHDGEDIYGREDQGEDEEDEEEEEGQRLRRQSSIETFDILNERSTKNSIIELMRGGLQDRHQQPAQQPEPPPPPPPPVSEPKGYAESIHR
jgi:hypothetical protein